MSSFFNLVLFWKQNQNFSFFKLKSSLFFKKQKPYYLSQFLCLETLVGGEKIPPQGPEQQTPHLRLHVAWDCLLWAHGLARNPDTILDITYFTPQNWSFWPLHSIHLSNATHMCQSILSGYLSSGLRQSSVAAQLGKLWWGVLLPPSFDLGVAALVQFAGVWKGWSRLPSSLCVQIPAPPPAKFSFASAWTRPGFMTSRGVSWTRLLTLIDVIALKIRILGKGARSRRWLMKKEESWQIWLPPAKKNLILNGTEGMGSQIKHMPDVGGFYLISMYFRAVSGNEAAWM